MNSLNKKTADAAFEEALKTALEGRVGKQRPHFRTRVELMERAAKEKYPYAKLIELRRFSNGDTINEPSWFSLLQGHQRRLFTIWLNF